MTDKITTAVSDLLLEREYKALWVSTITRSLVIVIMWPMVFIVGTGPLDQFGTSILLAMLLTGASAVVIDILVFKRLRERANALTMVFASFGVALIVRNVIGLMYGLSALHYNTDIAFAMRLSTDPMLLVKADQLLILAITFAVMGLLHLLLTRTTLGFALRAVSENPTLAQVNGVDKDKMVKIAWLLGGGLAAMAGVFYALNNQLNPVMGRDLVLSLFAAAIVGGIGSVVGAVLGGFIVGLASSLALMVIPSGYNPAIPFIIILLVLYVRPYGLFGSTAPGEEP